MTTNDVNQFYILTEADGASSLTDFITNATKGQYGIWKSDKTNGSLTNGLDTTNVTGSEDFVLFVKDASSLSYGGANRTITISPSDVTDLRVTSYKAGTQEAYEITTGGPNAGDVITISIRLNEYGSLSQEDSHEIVVVHTATGSGDQKAIVEKLSAALSNYAGYPHFGKQVSTGVNTIYDNPIFAITETGTTFKLTMKAPWWGLGRGEYRYDTFEMTVNNEGTPFPITHTPMVKPVGDWHQVADMEYFFKKMRGEIYDTLGSGKEALDQVWDYDSSKTYGFVDMVGYVKNSGSGHESKVKYTITFAIPHNGSTINIGTPATELDQLGANMQTATGVTAIVDNV